MALGSGKKIIRRSWDVIPMLDTVIARVNELGSDQPEHLTFTDCHGRLIGDSDEASISRNDAPQIPGVDGDVAGVGGVGGENLNEVEEEAVLPNNAPPTEVKEEAVLPNNAPPTNTSDANTSADVVAREQGNPIQPDATEPPPLRRFARTKTQPSVYIPSMSGSRYSYAVTQLESEGVLNPDAHMSIQQDFYEADPDVVAAVMTPLSLKSGLKEWGEKAYKATESEMKQLHFRNTLERLHCRIPHVPQAETRWKNQRENSGGRHQTERIHLERRRQFTNCHNRCCCADVCLHQMCLLMGHCLATQLPLPPRCDFLHPPHHQQLDDWSKGFCINMIFFWSWC
jgi:hypothetical protein